MKSQPKLPSLTRSKLASSTVPTPDDALDWMRNIYYIGCEQRTLMAAAFLLGLVLTLLAYLLSTTVYKSQVSFIVNESPYILAVDPRANADDIGKFLFQSLISGIKSEDMQTILAERLHVPYENLCFIGATYPKPSYDRPNTARIDVQPVLNSRMVAISVYSHDPAFALRVAREITSEVLSLNTIVGRITSLQTDLAVVQAKINRLTDALGVISSDRSRYEQEIKLLDAYLRQGGILQNYPAFQNDETLKKLRSRETTVDSDNLNLHGKVGETRNSRSQLESYAQQLAVGLRSNLMVARVQEQTQELSLQEQRSISNVFKDEIDKLTQATSSSQMRRDLHLFDRKSAPGEKASVMVVANQPMLAKGPTMPNPFIYAIIGLSCSFLFAAFAGVFNHKFDRAVRNPKQLELLHGHACLALLPESDTSSLAQPFGPAPEPESVSGLSYLRSQMLRATLAGEDEKIFVFSGLGQHAESAELVTKLAVLLAKAEKKTLLIDFNFSNPQIATLMGIKSRKGLSEWMFTEEPIKNFIEYSVVRELAVIQPGRISGNTDDLISRRPLAPVLAQLQNEWDFILINAPNLLEESHLLLAAPGGSPVIAVARYADANLDDLDALAARCEECNFTFAGIVLHHYPRARLRSSQAAYELGAHRYVLESAAS